MARGTTWIERPVAASSIPNTPPMPLRAGPAYAEIDIVYAHELDNTKELILLHPAIRRDGQDEDEYHTPDEQSTQRCWKTTVLYQRIGPHPRLVQFIRADEWTGHPVLAKPTGPPLKAFLTAYLAALYETRSGGNSGQVTANHRVTIKCLPLMYQWALQLGNALRHVHSYGGAPLHLVFGDPKVSNCFISEPSMALSLLGFLDAGFGQEPQRHPGDRSVHRVFHPGGGNPSMHTDIFLVGCIVYELMTSYWPGTGQGLEWELESQLLANKTWPQLEAVFLGDVVRRCWTGEISTASQLMLHLQAAIRLHGWEIRGEDELEGFDAAALVKDL